MKQSFLIIGMVFCLAQHAVAETVLIQLQVVEGEGAINTTGTKAPKPVTVVVTDETGKPVQGAAITFRLPEEGASGFFESGLKSEIQITGPEGRASAWGIAWNDTPGPVKIRVTASKDQARAGLIVSQYLNERTANVAAPSPAPAAVAVAPQQGPTASTLKAGPVEPVSLKKKKSNKWLIVGVAAGGAVAAAVFAGRGGTSASSGGSTPGTPTPIPTISIGSPSITVGKP